MAILRLGDHDIGNYSGASKVDASQFGHGLKRTPQYVAFPGPLHLIPKS